MKMFIKLLSFIIFFHFIGCFASDASGQYGKWILQDGIPKYTLANWQRERCEKKDWNSRKDCAGNLLTIANKQVIYRSGLMSYQNNPLESYRTMLHIAFSQMPIKSPYADVDSMAKDLFIGFRFRILAKSFLEMLQRKLSYPGNTTLKPEQKLEFITKYIAKYEDKITDKDLMPKEDFLDAVKSNDLEKAQSVLIKLSNKVADLLKCYIQGLKIYISKLEVNTESLPDLNQLNVESLLSNPFNAVSLDIKNAVHTERMFIYDWMTGYPEIRRNDDQYVIFSKQCMCQSCEQAMVNWANTIELISVVYFVFEESASKIDPNPGLRNCDVSKILKVHFPQTADGVCSPPVYSEKQ